MIPEVYFIDSSFIYALLNKKDKNHSAAVLFMKNSHLRNSFVVTDMVLAEGCSMLSSFKGRKSIAIFIKEILSNKNYRILHTNNDMFWEGFNLFEKYGDKEWSLVDCVSFLAMEKAKIRFALTADHHFEQYGFISVLLHPEFL